MSVSDQMIHSVSVFSFPPLSICSCFLHFRSFFKNSFSFCRFLSASVSHSFGQRFINQRSWSLTDRDCIYDRLAFLSFPARTCVWMMSMITNGLSSCCKGKWAEESRCVSVGPAMSFSCLLRRGRAWDRLPAEDRAACPKDRWEANLGETLSFIILSCL